MVGFDIFKVAPVTYNKKLAASLVLRIRMCKDERKINELQIQLFSLMSKIVIKNINNYLKYMFNSDVSAESLERFEAQSEAFIIMSKCVTQYKPTAKFDCFYFYYNKSLSRNFWKLFCEAKRNKANFEKASDLIRIRKSKSTNDHYSMDLLISQLKISDDEKFVLHSKLLGQSKQDFLEINKEFGATKYTRCNQNVKVIILKLIEDGEL